MALTAHVTPPLNHFLQESTPFVETIIDNLRKASPYAPLRNMLDEFQGAFTSNVDEAAARKAALGFRKRFQAVAANTKFMPEERARAAFLAQKCESIMMI